MCGWQFPDLQIFHRQISFNHTTQGQVGDSITRWMAKVFCARGAIALLSHISQYQRKQIVRLLEHPSHHIAAWWRFKVVLLEVELLHPCAKTKLLPSYMDLFHSSEYIISTPFCHAKCFGWTLLFFFSLLSWVGKTGWWSWQQTNGSSTHLGWTFSAARLGGRWRPFFNNSTVQSNRIRINCSPIR